MTTYAKMDPEVKTKWVAALRSGKYKQGTSKLHNFDTKGLCCLGVLCEVLTLPRRSSLLRAAYFYDFPTGSPSCMTVPDGFCGLSPRVKEHLIAMNDTNYKSFDEIADWVAKNL